MLFIWKKEKRKERCVKIPLGWSVDLLRLPQREQRRGQRRPEERQAAVTAVLPWNTHTRRQINNKYDHFSTFFFISLAAFQANAPISHRHKTGKLLLRQSTHSSICQPQHISAAAQCFVGNITLAQNKLLPRRTLACV